jgi:hypothetical protein
MVISSNMDSLSMLRMIYDYLSYLVLGLFLLSLNHKMIGAEMLSCAQFLYLSNALLKTEAVLYSAVRKFSLVTVRS